MLLVDRIFEMEKRINRLKSLVDKITNGDILRDVEELKLAVKSRDDYIKELERKLGVRIENKSISQIRKEYRIKDMKIPSDGMIEVSQSKIISNYTEQPEIDEEPEIIVESGEISLEN